MDFMQLAGKRVLNFRCREQEKRSLQNRPAVDRSQRGTRIGRAQRGSS